MFGVLDLYLALCGLLSRRFFFVLGLCLLPVADAFTEACWEPMISSKCIRPTLLLLMPTLAVAAALLELLLALAFFTIAECVLMAGGNLGSVRMFVD